MRKFIPLSILIGLLTLLAVIPVAAGGHPGDPPGLAKAIAAKNAHADDLLGINGVVGVGVGLSNGKPAIVVFTEAAGVAGIPRSLDGVQVRLTCLAGLRDWHRLRVKVQTKTTRGAKSHPLNLPQRMLTPRRGLIGLFPLASL
jgi:hypothetical protein